MARRLAQLTKTRLLLNSATPSITTYNEARSDALALAELPRRVRGQAAKMELVDMRNKLARGNRFPLSHRLLKTVDQALKTKKQAILFLNHQSATTFIHYREYKRSVEYPQCSV